jgi:RimJ/RimL family protein N-acetyltransferase
MLDALSVDDMESVRVWRNACYQTLRTPFKLTKEQQEEWYKNEVCNRNSRSRFYKIIFDGRFVGYGGIENIQWENRIGEISLLINPAEQKNGYGFHAAIEIIENAFNNLNLHTVFAECYLNNSAINFWHKVFQRFKNPVEVNLPNRKYWNGKYYDSMYFSVSND